MTTEYAEEEKRLALDVKIAIHVFGLPEDWANKNTAMPLARFSKDRDMAEIVNQHMQTKVINSDDPDVWNRELTASLDKWVGLSDTENHNLSSTMMVLTPDEICMAALRALGVCQDES